MTQDTAALEAQRAALDAQISTQRAADAAAAREAKGLSPRSLFEQLAGLLASDDRAAFLADVATVYPDPEGGQPADVAAAEATAGTAEPDAADSAAGPAFTG
jgi:hypothetical protein